MGRRVGAGKAPAVESRARGGRVGPGRAKATEIAGQEADAEPSGRVRKAPRPHLCRTVARKWLAEELPAIFETFAQGAKRGDVVCLKALLTLSGFDKEETHAVPTRQRRGRSLAKILLDELRRHPPKRMADERADAGDPSPSSDADMTE